MRTLSPIVVGLITLSVSASSFIEQPFPETVKNASQIVRGKVGKSETLWTTLPDGSKHLFTYYELEVSEGFKGRPKAGSPIRIRELGGEKDGVSLQVSGTAHFGSGEDVVVMLGENLESGDRAYPVVGMMMGKFNVEKGTDGKEYLKGPGIGSSLHPTLRTENSPKPLTQVSLENLREIVRTQATDALNIRPSSTPTHALTEPLLGSRVNESSSVPRPVSDEGLKSPSTVEKPVNLKPLILILGMIIGGLWFLKSKKKRG